jgi:hypothetical protein
MKKTFQHKDSIFLKTLSWCRQTLLQQGKQMVLVASIFALISATGCKKEDKGHSQVSDPLDKYQGLPKQTLSELRAAQLSTLRYQDIRNAQADGYADINVVVQNMGFHYMKSSLADTVFDPTKPEILVYNKSHQGAIELVAVEYAVPIDLQPDRAPAGFSGDKDVWKRDTGFGLWLLHAWIWAFNPDGVFNPTNTSIHLH